MAIFRKENDKNSSLPTYHCDEHRFKTSDPEKLEDHLKLHGKKVGDFWKKRKNVNKNVTEYYCDRHDFHSYNPEELEEHERMHALIPDWGFDRD